MLPLVLVLLVAHSAVSAPSVVVNQRSVNDIPRPQDTGSLVNSGLTRNAFELLDGGEANIYTLTMQDIISDMADSGDSSAQALALAQAISLIGETAGSPGDACEYANLANAHASSNVNGNHINGYVNRLNANIDAIARLAVDPNAANYISGPSSGCAGGGRTYQFEQVWDNALSNASPYAIGLLNEQYCTARRLYGSYNGPNNNVAAALSASTVPQVLNHLSNNVQPLANFLRVVASGGNPAQAAAVAKQALSQGY